MDSITELMQNIEISNFDLGSSSWVDVTHINNPDSFYVRPTSYRMYMPVIEARDKKAASLDLKLQTNIIYKSKTLQCYCRGKILFVNKCDENIVTYDIFAPDFGCLDKRVTLRRIYQPKYELNIPPLATHCQLADCKPKNDFWTNKEIDAMKFYVGEEKAKLFVRGKTHNKLIVDLINTCPDDIATMLALTGYTTFGYNNNIISRIPSLIQDKHYYSFNKLQPGDTLHVRLQSGNNLNAFYVAQINDYKTYIKERGKVMCYFKEKCNIKSDDLKENKPVSVFVSQCCSYERAIITTITVPEEKALVQLVDWGSILEADISQMKPMTKSYFDNPAMAIYCSAEQCQLWNNSLQKFLYPGFEFMITIRESGNELASPFIVSVSPLNKTLNSIM